VSGIAKARPFTSAIFIFERALSKGREGEFLRSVK